MYSVYKLNKQGDIIQPWCTPFPIWNQSVVPCPVLTVASWPAYRFLRIQVRWLVFPSLAEFSTVCCDPHSQSFGVASKAKVMFFWNSLAFSMIQRMLAIWSGSSAFSMIQRMLVIWSLVPLPFLNPAWTSGSSWFTYCWSMAWRILNITSLACEMSATVQ